MVRNTVKSRKKSSARCLPFQEIGGFFALVRGSIQWAIERKQYSPGANSKTNILSVKRRPMKIPIRHEF